MFGVWQSCVGCCCDVVVGVWDSYMGFSGIVVDVWESYVGYNIVVGAWDR